MRKFKHDELGEALSAFCGKPKPKDEDEVDAE